MGGKRPARTVLKPDWFDARARKRGTVEKHTKERDWERLSAMVRSCIMMNAFANLTEEAYRQQYTDLTRQYEERNAEYEALPERKKTMESTATVFSGILFRLTELDEIPIDFDEVLWNTLIDHVTICADEQIVFSFMDGMEITKRI